MATIIEHEIYFIAYLKATIKKIRMKTQALKIELMKQILAIDNVEIIESIASFVKEKLENSDEKFYFEDEDETQKGIETILKMVEEFK